MEPIDSEDFEHGITLELYPDLDPECSNPRDWTNAGVIVSWYREYKLGDDQISWPERYGLGA